MTDHTRRAAAGAWALVLSVAVGSLALADEKAQGTPTFTGGAADATDRPAENALFIRTQVAF
jgi:hypothetical protein